MKELSVSFLGCPELVSLSVILPILIYEKHVVLLLLFV